MSAPRMTFTPAPGSRSNALPDFAALGINLRDGRHRANGEIACACPQCGDGNSRKKKLYVNEAKGVFHCFQCGWSGSVATAESGSRIDPADIQRQMDEKQRSDAARHAAAANRARESFAGYALTGTHDYLQRKRIDAHGGRFGADRYGPFIAVPMMDIDGAWRGLQRIYKSAKVFEKGTQVPGALYVLGELSDAATIVVVESFANAASIKQSDDGLVVVVAFDAGNLKAVVAALRQKYPNARIIIVADNDIRPADSKLENTGVVKAHAAAESAGAVVVIPEMSGTKCDVSDVYLEHGAPGVLALLAGAGPGPGPDSTAAELNTDSDLYRDLAILRKCHPAQARATARKILTRYAAQSPRKRSFTALADEVIASLPSGCNPALPRGLHSFTEWLERQARMRAVRSSSIEQGQLRNAGIEVLTVADLNGLAVAIAADSRPLWLVRAAHGTGKTELVLKPLAQLPGCAVAITNRVSLVADLCNRLALSNYQTIRHGDIEAVDALGLCLPSVVNPKFGDVLNRADSVLIDEVGACWRELHSLGGTLKRTGPEAVKRLVAMMNQARIAVGVDADLSTQDVLSIAGLVRRPVVVVEMVEVPHGGRVTFADADDVKGAILNAVTNGDKCRVACDSSRAAIELTALLRAANPDKRICCIHSRGGDSTAGDPEVLALLKDVNSGIQDIDVLVHSPTVESGVSITTPHFTRTFGLFGGRSVSPSAFIQMLKRDRTATLFEIGLAGLCRQWLETRPRAILDNLEATHRANVELVGDAGAVSGLVRIEPATPFDARVVDYLATRNVDLNDAGQNLLLLLESRGYQIEQADGLPKISKEEKQQARQLADADYADAVLTAAPIDSERRAELDSKYQLNPMETAEVERYDAATANGIEPAELTADDLRLFEHGALTKWNRRWDLLHAPETAGLANDVSDADFVPQLALRRHELAIADAYRTFFEVTGFDRVTGSGEVTADSAMEAWRNLQAAPCRAVLEHSGLCRFDRVPKYPVRWAGDALKKFGLALEEHGHGEDRRYTIQRAVLNTKDGLTVKAPGWAAMTRCSQMRLERSNSFRSASVSFDPAELYANWKMREAVA